MVTTMATTNSLYTTKEIGGQKTMMKKFLQKKANLVSFD